MSCAIADPRCTLTCQISSRSVYSVALCWRKTPIFAVFWTSAFRVVASWQQSDKVEHGAQTFPYSTASKSFLYSNAFIAKSGAQSWTFKSVTNKQTDKHTKNSTFFGHPGGGLNPSPIKLGMVIQDLEHVLAPRKLGGLTHNFAARGH